MLAPASAAAEIMQMPRPWDLQCANKVERGREPLVDRNRLVHQLESGGGAADDASDVACPEVEGSGCRGIHRGSRSSASSASVAARSSWADAFRESMASK